MVRKALAAALLSFLMVAVVGVGTAYAGGQTGGNNDYPIPPVDVGPQISDPPGDAGGLGITPPRQARSDGARGDDLAFTGFDADIIRIAVLLLGAGGVLLYAEKRRRSHVA